MARTFIRQDTQIRKSDTYDDTVTPSLANYETNPVSVEDDLNSLRSQVQNLVNRSGAGFPAGNWYDDLTAPSTLEAGTQRGVDAVNDGLHAVEKKRTLKCVWNLHSISGGSGVQGVILGTGELPSNTTAAVGAVTTLGTVVAAATTFGTFSASDEIAGSNALGPKNLVQIVDSSTRDPILDANSKRIYGLLQSETATDGHTITDTTTTRVQISFVVINGTGTDLQLVSAGAMDGETFDFCHAERVRWEDRAEQDWLPSADIDVPSGTTVTRQVAYDNQGTTPVDLTTNATLDLEGAGLAWRVRDDLEANLLSVIEGSAGGTSEVEFGSDVDLWDNDAAENDVAAGIKANTGGTRPVHVGVTDGVVETTAGDLHLLATTELILDDGNQTGSTWAQTGIKLSETTAEWDTFETDFGEVSILNAISQAKASGGRSAPVYANVTAAIAADADVGGVGGGTNLDAQLPDMSSGTFTDAYDIFLNGERIRLGANAAANHDAYPGTSLANGQLKFEFPLAIDDVICVVPHV